MDDTTRTPPVIRKIPTSQLNQWAVEVGGFPASFNLKSALLWRRHTQQPCPRAEVFGRELFWYEDDLIRYASGEYA